MTHSNLRRLRAALLLSTTLGTALYAAGAMAQNAQSSGTQDQLQEVVVTATRQTDTVNRVPLSITAQTQQSLDQEGVHNITDLQGQVPALQIATVGGPGVANPTIRGIANTPAAATAATTGFYLDDTPIQKRNTGGGVFTLNGTPLPPIFDLDRIEVLRGPQGTLYGGSSEGGTIRYITPQPSFTSYSAYVRTEVSQVQDGGTNYEAGVALGGPIIKDKLAFRGSIWAKHDAGWIDIEDPISQQIRFKDANSGHERLGRLALAWQINDEAKATLSYFTSQEFTNLTATNFNLSVPGTVTEPTQCYNTATVANLPFPTRSNPPTVATGDAACAAAKAANPAVYIRPGATYGPYNVAPFTQLGGSIGNGNINPTTTNINIPTLTLDYNFEHMTAKFISSIIYDETRGWQEDTSQLSFRNIVGGTYTVPGQAAVPVPRGFGFIAALPNFWQTNGNIDALNKRNGITEELRFASEANAMPFSWVAGVYYSNQHGKSNYLVAYDLDALAGYLYGISSTQRYGVTGLPNPSAPSSNDIFDTHQQTTHDNEVAAYGEANYYVTKKLRLTAGLRYSRVSFDYYNQEIGPGSGFNSYSAPGAITSGSITNSPLTPKFSAEYQITDRDMVYVTAAKGFRPGGVNNLLSPNICDFAVGQFGLTVFQLPTTFNADSVWSYEVGGKLRILDNRVQLNGDVYRIDWQNPQTQVALGVGCGVPVVANGGNARSQGFELESQAAPFHGMTVDLAVGYDKTTSLQSAFGAFGPVNLNNGAPVTTGYAIDLAGTPTTPYQAPWSVQIGGRYEHEVSATAKAYIRADFRWTSKYLISFPNTQSYAPDASEGVPTKRLNLRAGVEMKGFDINVFAENLLGQEGNTAGGRSGCPYPVSGSCSTFSSYNPFLTQSYLPYYYGVQVSYRY